MDNGVRGLFAGSYGGSLGFVQLGRMVAAASALALALALASIIATIAGAVAVVPLSCLAWDLRLHISRKLRRRQVCLRLSTTAPELSRHMKGEFHSEESLLFNNYQCCKLSSNSAL